MPSTLDFESTDFRPRKRWNFNFAPPRNPYPRRVGGFEIRLKYRGNDTEVFYSSVKKENRATEAFVNNPIQPPAPDALEQPNFPAYRQGSFNVDIESPLPAKSELAFEPLRPRSESGQPLPRWELVCRTLAGLAAGGCAITLPRGRTESPSPQQAPHPVIGEWLSALRYTGHRWIECGPFTIAAGFPEEGVAELLWEALVRLMHRNGVSFLVGTAPAGSLLLDMALRRGARALEPSAHGQIQRYFLFVAPAP